MELQGCSSQYPLLRDLSKPLAVLARARLGSPPLGDLWDRSIRARCEGAELPAAAGGAGSQVWDCNRRARSPMSLSWGCLLSVLLSLQGGSSAGAGNGKWESRWSFLWAQGQLAPHAAPQHSAALLAWVGTAVVGPPAVPKPASLELPQVRLLWFVEGHLICSLVVSVPDCAMQTSATVRCPQLGVLTMLVPGCAGSSQVMP